jgi:four helix bundle protein
MENNIILEKTFNFSLKIIELYKKMIKEKEYVLSKQLLRSATSIGANVEETMAGHSKKDFLAKLIISHKEARETRYWLRLIKHGNLSSQSIDEFINEVNEIINILTAIIRTTKKNLGIFLTIFFQLFELALLIKPVYIFDSTSNSILNS